MSDTLTYKTKERYSFGWTDIRAMTAPQDTQRGVVNENITTWTTEQLRNAWLVMFGSDWVPYAAIDNHENQLAMDIGICLEKRGQLERTNDPNNWNHMYRLIPEHANCR